MNTAVTKCPRCTGAAGAHFAFCFVAQLWERLMGPGYPWAPPAPAGVVSECPDCESPYHGRPCPRVPAETEIPLPPEPPDGDWGDWTDESEQWAEEVDPPDRAGVYEDFLVSSGQMESDTQWLPDDHYWEQWHAERQVDHDLSVEAAVTHLPDGYYDQLTLPDPPEAPSKPGRRYNTSGLRKAREELLKGQEDTAVLFVYDCCEFTPGGRVALDELYDRFDEWRAASEMPSMSKQRLRSLLVEVGLEVRQGRLPGMRTSGKAPLLVHGVTLRTEVPEAEPTVVVRPKPKQREKHALIGAKPGGELPKQVRELIEPLITEQGWAYQPHSGTGRGKPRVTSPAGKVCTLPSSPHSNGRTLENTRSFLKQNGALL